MNDGDITKNLKFNLAFSNLVVIFSLLLANRRVLVFQDFYLKTPFSEQHLWVESLFWFVITCWAIISITINKKWTEFYKKFKVNWFLLPFLLIAALSLIWTNHPKASLYHVLVLLTSSFIAACIGITMNRKRFIGTLAWCGVIFVIGSYATIVFLPNIGTMIGGTMIGHPYYGAWRGVFWHRNHLSIIMALFSIIFVYKVFQYKDLGWLSGILWGVVYLVAGLLVVFSRSLTGILLWVFLHFLVIVGGSWVKWRHKLSPTHYRIFIVGVFGVLVAVFFAFEKLAGMVNKTGSWSGRIVLWNWLLENLVRKRPILGHGFGAIWNFFDFRNDLGFTVGWGMPILIGDNGYIDLLLHLGGAGLILFLGAILLTFIRFCKDALDNKTLLAFIPVLIVPYLIIANISFSLFLELESFFWILLVVMLFNINSTASSISDLTKA